MKHAGTTVLVVLVALMFVPMTNTSASDIHDEDLPTMKGPIDVAVYFADNMAFTPQWRLDNYIRIEVMILNATGDDILEAEHILISDTDVGEEYTPTNLRENPEMLFDTNMISVSEIWINITSVPTGPDSTGDRVASWYSNFEGDGAGNTVIREINGEGHLIYGGKWDTSGVTDPGFYNVSVGLPGTYNIKWAIQHDRGVEEDPVEEVAVLSEDPADPIGYMSVPDARGDVDTDTNEALITLGELLDGGGSGTNGGGDVAGGNGPAYQGEGVRRR